MTGHEGEAEVIDIKAMLERDKNFRRASREAVLQAGARSGYDGGRSARRRASGGWRNQGFQMCILHDRVYRRCPKGGVA